MQTSLSSTKPSARSHTWIQQSQTHPQVGQRSDWEQPCREWLGAMADEKLTMTWHWALTAQRTNRILGFIPKNTGSRGREGTAPSALPLSDPTCSAEHSSGAPSVRRMWNCWSKSWGKRTGAPPLQRGWKSWGCSAWRRKVEWRPHGNLPASEGATGKLERDSLSRTVVTGQGVTGPNWKRANLA